MPARRRRAADKPPDAVSRPLEADASLDRYGEMRDFALTPEPASRQPHIGDPQSPLTFVVQKHRATRLHYDLRLEMDGAMLSWPVPNGPAAVQGEKRLAIMTEPHPLEYAVFEGVIPEGGYGAGEVIVWDRGTFSPDENGPLVFEDRAEADRRMREAVSAGKVSITLRGHRMKGSWALVKTQQSANSWLLIKHRDDATTGVDLAETYQDSVLSGLTTADLQGGRKLPPGSPPALLAHELKGARRTPLPTSVEPMQAYETRTPFDDPGWVFEPKLDGIRAVAAITSGGRGESVHLVTRRGNEVTHAYPALAKSLHRQPANSLVVDGEIVAFDEHGVPSFERLQQRMNLTNPVEVRQAERDIPVTYFVFDVLYVDGVDVRRAPLEERRRLLQRTLMPQSNVQLVDQLEMDGVEAFQAAVGLGLEGLVAKKRGSSYTTGTRSQSWVKIKQVYSDDFVVVGFTRGLNSRSKTFGALAIATRDEAGNLVSVGRVGSGFDEPTLKAFRRRLDTMVIDEPALSLGPEWRKDLTPVRPDLVVEVAYTQVTSEGNLRAPVFKRLREDKPAADVRSLPAFVLPSPSTPTLIDSIGEQGAAVIAQLEAMNKQGTLDVDGHRVSVSNLDKVFWPEHDGQRALTKRDLLIYYARMAPYLLDQARDRPLTMTRYPGGIEGKFFYQKHVEDAPPYLESVLVHTESGGGDQQFLMANNMASLMWLGQMGDLAIHTSLARVSPEPDGHGHSLDFSGSREQVERSLLNYPDFVLFDLDPYIYRGDEKQGEEPEFNRRAFDATCEVAGWLKGLLDDAGLSSFVKTSGATGLHIYVPVLRQYEYDVIRGIAQTLGGFVVQMHPKEATMEWVSEKRRGKVFVDANQNSRVKNLACAYSPRAKPGAPVSMPLAWNELGKVYPTEFTILTAPQRVERVGDLWAHILDAKHDLESVLGD